MAIRILRAARDDLRGIVRHYRSIPPPKTGRELASRVVDELQKALEAVQTMPLSRQEHPDIPGVRLVHLATFPYCAFYLVEPDTIVVVSLEHDASDHVARVLRRATAVT